MRSVKGFIAVCWIAALIGLPFFVGCETEVTQKEIEAQKEKIAKAEKTLEAMKERQQVEDKMESQLTALQEKIDRLGEQVENAEGDLEVKLRGEIAKLKTKYEQAQESLRKLRAASGDNWAQLRIEAEQAWVEVSTAVEQKIKEWTDDEDKDKSDSNKSGAKSDGGHSDSGDRMEDFEASWAPPRMSTNQF